MKTQLTKEQSQHLIDLGVPKGNMTGNITEFYGKTVCIDVFSMSDLLEILPKEIDSENGSLYLKIQMMNGVCSVCYEYFSNGDCKEYFEAEELIDALYELCVWCLGNKYITEI